MSDEKQYSVTANDQSDLDNHPQFKEFDRHLSSYFFEKTSSNPPNKLIGFLKGRDYEFTLIGENEHEHECTKPLVLPRVDPECVLAAIKFIIECKEDGNPVDSVIMISDDLNSDIEMYTDYFFDIIALLGVEFARRFYSPSF